jgi:hypothetical protein
MIAAPRKRSVTEAAPDPAQLKLANVNPATGLANDYLNHFNEAIMVLELMAHAPETLEDFMAWRPISYQQHFEASGLSQSALVIAAYESAPENTRQRLDNLAEQMVGILAATRDALRLGLSTRCAAILAQEAAAELKPLAARAGAVINGTSTEDVPTQALVDAVLDA